MIGFFIVVVICVCVVCLFNCTESLAKAAFQLVAVFCVLFVCMLFVCVLFVCLIVQGL